MKRAAMRFYGRDFCFQIQISRTLVIYAFDIDLRAIFLNGRNGRFARANERIINAGKRQQRLDPFLFSVLRPPDALRYELVRRHRHDQPVAHRAGFLQMPHNNKYGHTYAPETDGSIYPAAKKE